MAPFFALDTGFHVGDPWVALLAFTGVAIFAAVGALSHQEQRAFSASIIYLALGVGLAIALNLLGESALDPFEDTLVIERVAEFALVIAVFSTGISLEAELRWRTWRSTVLLLAVAMPISIALVAAFGSLMMGLPIGAAILLGAVLAPTDPVLAGDVGVGGPGDERQGEPRFTLSAEAAANDGLASPFVVMGLFVAEQGGTGWLGEWALIDLLYAVVVAAVIGIGLGYGIGGLLTRLRDRRMLGRHLDGWVALPTALVVYGVCELLGTYGLVGAFVAGLAFRRYEYTHEYNGRVHAGAEVVEKASELAVILLLGSIVTVAGLSEPGLSGWLLAPALILIFRPLPVVALLTRSGLKGRERGYIAWFGVRGVAALYYAAVVIDKGVLSHHDASRLFWTVVAVVGTSIILHGASATPLTRRLAPHQPPA